MIERVLPFTLGYDLEFCLRGPGKSFIPAYQYISDPDHVLPVGLDGVTDIAEMRGFYSSRVSEIIENITNNFRYHTPDEAKMYDLVAGAYPGGNPVGFHLHFGLPYNGQSKNAVMGIMGLLALLTEPRPDGMNRRLNSQYGNVGAFESKPYGFEYKSMYSFIETPEFTKHMLTIAGLVGWFFSSTRNGGLDAELIMPRVGDIYDRQDLEKAREFIDKTFTTFLGLSNNEEFIDRMCKKNDLLTYTFELSDREQEALEFMLDFIRKDKTVNADVDLRKTWMTDHEPIQLIYSHNWRNQKLTTGPSLRPIYITENTKDSDVPILISGLAVNEEEAVSRWAAETAHKISILKYRQKVYRTCPTINIRPRLCNATDTVSQLRSVLSEVQPCVA